MHTHFEITHKAVTQHPKELFPLPVSKHLLRTENTISLSIYRPNIHLPRNWHKKNRKRKKRKKIVVR